MIKEIEELAARVPFEPFSIQTSDGRQYRVPTLDHIWFPPGTRRVGVLSDKGAIAILAPIHISSITKLVNGDR